MEKTPESESNGDVQRADAVACPVYGAPMPVLDCGFTLQIQQSTTRYRCSRGHEWDEIAGSALRIAKVDRTEQHFNGVCFTCLADTLVKHAGEFTGKPVEPESSLKE